MSLIVARSTDHRVISGVSLSLSLSVKLALAEHTRDREQDEECALHARGSERGQSSLNLDDPSCNERVVDLIIPLFLSLCLPVCLSLIAK